MTWEYSRIFLKVILVLENLSEVDFWTSKQIFECFKSMFWTLMTMFDSPTAYYWTSNLFNMVDWMKTALGNET